MLQPTHMAFHVSHSSPSSIHSLVRSLRVSLSLSLSLSCTCVRVSANGHDQEDLVECLQERERWPSVQESEERAHDTRCRCSHDSRTCTTRSAYDATDIREQRDRQPVSESTCVCVRVCMAAGEGEEDRGSNSRTPDPIKLRKSRCRVREAVVETPRTLTPLMFPAAEQKERETT